MKTIDLSHRIYDRLTTHPSHPRIVINNFVDHAFTAPGYQPPCKGFATKQGIKAVGIDLGNIEDNADMTRCVQMFLLEEKVPIYENLANRNKGIFINLNALKSLRPFAFPAVYWIFFIPCFKIFSILPADDAVVEKFIGSFNNPQFM